MSRRPYFTATRSGGVGDGIGDKNAVQPVGTVFKELPVSQTVWVDVGNGVQLANLGNYLGAVQAGAVGAGAVTAKAPGGSASPGAGPGKAGVAVAQTTKGPGVTVVAKPAPGATVAPVKGPAAAVVTTVAPKRDKNKPGISIGSGPGNPFAGTPPLTPGKKDKATGGHAGFEIHPNPWFSNVEDFWETRYGEPGEWLGGGINIGADLVYNLPGVIDAAGVNPRTPGVGAEWFQETYETNVKPPDKQEPVDWGW